MGFSPGPFVHSSKQAFFRSLFTHAANTSRHAHARLAAGIFMVQLRPPDSRAALITSPQFARMQLLVRLPDFRRPNKRMVRAFDSIEDRFSLPRCQFGSHHVKGRNGTPLVRSAVDQIQGCVGLEALLSQRRFEQARPNR